jgi:hypothetical protein
MCGEVCNFGDQQSHIFVLGVLHEVTRNALRQDHVRVSITLHQQLKRFSYFQDDRYTSFFLRKLSRKDAFREDSVCGSQTLLKGVNVILLIFYAFFHLIWKQFGTKSVHKYLWGNCEFCKSRRSEKHTLRKGVSEFLPGISTFIVSLVKIGVDLHTMLLII